MITFILIVRGLARVVAVHGELLGGAGDAVIVKDGVDQGRAVGVAVEQRLDRRGRGVEQRRHGRGFVVNDLRAYRRAEPDLMDLRRRWRWRRLDGRRADALIAEQLIGRRLIVALAFAAVEDVLVVVAAVLVVVQRLGLARVDLRERRLRLIVLRITGRMLERAARGCGGRLARSRRGRAGRGGRAGPRRGRSRLMILHRVRQVVLVVAALVQAAFGNEREGENARSRYRAW